MLSVLSLSYSVSAVSVGSGDFSINGFIRANSVPVNNATIYIYNSSSHLKIAEVNSDNLGFYNITGLYNDSYLFMFMDLNLSLVNTSIISFSNGNISDYNITSYLPLAHIIVHVKTLDSNDAPNINVSISPFSQYSDNPFVTKVLTNSQGVAEFLIPLFTADTSQEAYSFVSILLQNSSLTRTIQNIGVWRTTIGDFTDSVGTVYFNTVIYNNSAYSNISVSGSLLDELSSSKLQINATVRAYTLLNNDLFEVSSTNAVDGDYTLSLPGGFTYTIMDDFALSGQNPAMLSILAYQYLGGHYDGVSSSMSSVDLYLLNSSFVKGRLLNTSLQPVNRGIIKVELLTVQNCIANNSMFQWNCLRWAWDYRLDNTHTSVTTLARSNGDFIIRIPKLGMMNLNTYILKYAINNLDSQTQPNFNSHFNFALGSSRLNITNESIVNVGNIILKPAGKLNGYLLGTHSSTDAFNVFIFNKTSGMFVVSADCYEDNGERVYWAALPVGNYSVFAIKEAGSDWANPNMSSVFDVEIPSVNSSYQLNLTTNISATRVLIGVLNFTGRWQRDAVVVINETTNSKIYSKPLYYGTDTVDFVMPKGVNFTVYVPSFSVYHENRDSKIYNSNVNSRIFELVYSENQFTIVRGVVTDSDGNRLADANVKVALFKHRENSQDCPEFQFEGACFGYDDWMEASVNSTKTDSQGRFSLAVPVPSLDARYMIIADYDNLSTPGVDFVEKKSTNNWRGYFVSVDNNLTVSLEMEPGATLKLRLKQSPTADINTSWLQSNFNSNRIESVYAIKIKKKPWNYDKQSYDSLETKNNNADVDRNIATYTLNVPVGNITVIAGLRLASHSNLQNPYLCIQNITVPTTAQGSIISYDCVMENYSRINISGISEADFIVSRGSNILYMDSLGPWGSSLFIKPNLLYNITIQPWGSRTSFEFYDVNSSQQTIQVSQQQSNYRIDINIPMNVQPSTNFFLEVIPRDERGNVVNNTNVSYELYKDNVFYSSGSSLTYNPTARVYSTILNIPEPGEFTIKVKAGNRTSNSFFYSQEMRDVQVWSVNVMANPNKWRYSPGETALVELAAFSANNEILSGNYSVRIFNPESNKYYTVVSNIHFDSGGRTNFTMPDFLSEGWYRITVDFTNGTDSGRTGVWFHMTNLNMEIVFKKFEVSPDENQTISFLIKDREGNPIPNMTINVSDSSSTFANTTITDSSGRATMLIPNSYYSNSFGFHELTITATSKDGKRERTFEGFVVVPVRLFINSNGKRSFSPGENITWTIGVIAMTDIKIPPDEACFANGHSSSFQDGRCDSQEFNNGQSDNPVYQRQAHKGDLIPSPVRLRIYYPNGTQMYDEELETPMTGRPLLSLSNYSAGNIPGKYMVVADLKGMIKATLTYDVKTLDIKPSLKSVYTPLEPILINVSVFNFTSTSKEPLNNTPVNATLYLPNGVSNATVQNTTDSTGRTTLVFQPLQSAGTYKVRITIPSTNDFTEVRFDINNLIVQIPQLSTQSSGSLLVLNITVQNSTLANVSNADVLVKLRKPDFSKDVYVAKQLSAGVYQVNITISPQDPSGKYAVEVEAEKTEQATHYYGRTESSFNVVGYNIETYVNKKDHSYTQSTPVIVYSTLKDASGNEVSGKQLKYYLYEVRKNTLILENTTGLTNSNGQTSLTYSNLPDGIYHVKINYEVNGSVLASADEGFFVSSLDVGLSTNKKEYSLGENLTVVVSASKNSQPINDTNGGVMLVIMDPFMNPMIVSNFLTSQTTTAKLYNATIQLPSERQFSGRYFIVASAQDFNQSFGSAATEVFVQNIQLNLREEHNSQNATVHINASGTEQINGTAYITLMKELEGIVSETTVQILNGYANYTFTNLNSGAYTIEVEVVSTNNDKAVKRIHFKISPTTTYNITISYSGVERKVFNRGSTISLNITPTPPQNSSLLLINPSDTITELPSSTTSISIPSNATTGYYTLRLKTPTINNVGSVTFEVI